MSNSPFRWGIIGLGGIAHKFATGLKAVPDAQLAAVASRSQAKADEFGSQYGAARRYGTYEAIAADPEIDAIYVSTPHNLHKENSLMCIDAGKPVLCEKPFTINAREAKEVIDTARSRKVFLMEAMWTRYFPIMVRLRELLKQQAIGDVEMVQADFGFRAGVDPKSRLFDLNLGGGGLLDVGIYPLSFASMVLGKPAEATGLAAIGETGVDERTGMVLRYPKGQIAVLSCAVRVNTPQEATVLGSEGSIKVHGPFWCPKAMTLHRNGKPDEEIELPYEGNGYNYEAIEVANCVRAGKLESSVMPLDETLSLMQTMDSLRAPWGLKYPME
ncbi:MAG TPA: Gfo/Idh/MocA family oxidoreductase [Capsulimonadaceae bacterium]|nr:Gfo/Idh/MocA family oxidoreductase [Capsulimonadaceae bacterium]